MSRLKTDLPHRVPAAAEWNTSSSPIYIRLSTLLRDVPGATATIAEVLQVRYVTRRKGSSGDGAQNAGRNGNSNNVVWVVQGGLLAWDRVGNALRAATFHDREIAFRDDGVFACAVEAPFPGGAALVDNLVAVLRRLVRLAATLLHVRAARGVRTTAASLSEITLAYHEPPGGGGGSEAAHEKQDDATPPAKAPPDDDAALSCTILLPADPNAPLTLALHPAPTNPHQRVRPFLEHYLNRSPAVFLAALRTTLPALRALARADAAGACSVRARALDAYRLAYRALPGTFDLVLKTRRGGSGAASTSAEAGGGAAQQQVWYLTEMPEPGALSVPRMPPAQQELVRQKMLQRPAAYRPASDALFREAGHGFRGLGSAIVCDVAAGVEEAVGRLDAMVRGALLSRAQLAAEQRAAAVREAAGRAHGTGPGASIVLD
jgi:hypothetical protein